MAAPDLSPPHSPQPSITFPTIKEPTLPCLQSKRMRMVLYVTKDLFSP